MKSLLLVKTLRDFGRSPAQSVALVLIVAVGVAAMVSMIGAFRNLDSSYTGTYRQMSFADETVTVESAPGAVVDRLGVLPGVRAVEGRLVLDTGMSVGTAGGQTIRARLVGMRSDTHPLVNDVLVSDGSYLSPSDGAGVLVEAHFAHARTVVPGAVVSPLIGGETVAFHVRGIAASPEYLVVSSSRQDVVPDASNFAVLFIDREELQRLAGAGDSVNDISLLFDPAADRSAVLEAVRSVLSPYGIRQMTSQADQPSNAALRLDLDGYREIGALLPTFILLASALSLLVMLGRMIRTQQQTIGLMMALGWSRGAIRGHFLTFAFAIGLLGSVLGAAAGVPLGRLITTQYAAELGIPLVFTRIYPDLLLVGIGISLAAAFCAGLVPSIRASRLLPAAAMRSDPSAAATRGRRSLVEKMVRVSLWTRLALRNSFRSRGRGVATLLGIVLAMILVLCSWALIDSMTGLVARTFHDVERWDAVVGFDPPLAALEAESVLQAPGVLRGEPFLTIPVTLAVGGRSETVLLTGLGAPEGMHALYLAPGRPPAEALADGRIVLTDSIARALGAAPGSRVSVTAPFSTSELTVGGLTDEMMSGVAYVSLDTARGLIPGSGLAVNGMYLAVEPGGADTVSSALYRVPGVSSVQLRSAMETAWTALMGLFYALMGMILLFSLAMAGALLFNAMTVNVQEQRREFATMRAIGTPRGRVSRVILGEALVLWAVSLAPGIVLGALGAAALGKSLQTDLFSIAVRPSPEVCVVTALGVLVVMMLSCLPAVRRIRRMNLATATKTLA